MRDTQKRDNIIILAVVIFIVFILLIVPGIMAVFLKKPVFSKAPGEVEAWISFWGSYLGGIFGSMAVIATTYLIIQHEKKLSEKTFHEKVRREEQVILKQDRLERERLLINFQLSSNAILAQKLNEFQSVFLNIHNTLLKAVVIKEAVLKQGEMKYTNEDVIRIRDEAIDQNKIMLDLAMIIMQETKDTDIIFTHFVEIHDNFKKVALAVRGKNFDVQWGLATIEDCKEKFSTVWKALIVAQLSEKEKLINSLERYKG